MPVHLLGIRHHGPGSCRNVVNYLEELQPDCLLLEGPAEAEALAPYVTHPAMKPPVALLAYQPDQPQQAVFYPFAEFSPEWQALCYAVNHQVEFHFFDLPLTYSMALKQQAEEETSTADSQPECSRSPLDYLAEADGYTDGEAWWERMVEHRKDNADIFQAVQEAITALRQALPAPAPLSHDLIREAWMRKMIRAAEKQGHQRIAVVCGAWHVPALAEKRKVTEDNELLKGLPRVKVTCTWIPWTYDRLATRSGYGAGIQSPGWYHYRWHHPDDDGTLWISRAANLLRQQNMDISVAHVIETVRLAHATAALRRLSAPSLDEYNEAITTVMGFGDDTLLQLIRESLLIDNRLGTVPDEVSDVPLLDDVKKTQKRLRVPFTSEIKELVLDLRKPNDLERSVLFHRLNLLGIDWAVPGHTNGNGTFKEKWTLYHKPEQVVYLIEKGIWGNTLETATRQYLLKETTAISHIPELTRLLHRVIPADLPQLVEAMTAQLDSLSAASTDLLEMMDAIPDLSHIVHYGNVRQLDFSKLNDMLHALTARILAGGVLACIHIDEETATDILQKLINIQYAIATLNRPELNEMWSSFIGQLRLAAQVHPLLAGYATRIENEQGRLTPEQMQDIFSFYTSPGNAPSDMAHWLEGFLHASGSILLLNDTLWNLINHWICTQSAEHFTERLPILRRTFSQFTPAERRKLGEKARASGEGGKVSTTASASTAHNEAEATRVIPLVCRLLGIETT